MLSWVRPYCLRKHLAATTAAISRTLACRTDLEPQLLPIITGAFAGTLTAFVLPAGVHFW